ncbi:MAG TPA: hypothetical protein DCE23_03870 [Firmicutes bacterium]|nr:hypothetical protein [Bacillota bacterium]
MDQVKIGKFILKLRKEKRMTQLELADKIGVTDRTISKWENGKGMPDLSLMQPLCNELGITINDLLNGEVNGKVQQEEKSVNVVNHSGKIIKLIIFYIVIFFASFIIGPLLGLLTIFLIISSILLPVCGLVKFGGYIFNFDIPFIMFQIGKIELNSLLVFPLSLIAGYIFYKLGKIVGKLLIKYINYVKEKHKELIK